MTLAALASPARLELLRALGAVADNPADAATACRAAGLPAPDAAGHTEVFVLNCPPYASIYLGPDGAVGGEGADRLAGFWRAIGVRPPAEPDHLTAIMNLYADLGDAAAAARTAAATAGLRHTQAALFTEHVWPWLPGYLDAVADLGLPALTGWARLFGQALSAETGRHPAGRQLPMALRAAPPGPQPGDGVGALVGALVTPVASGFIVTRRSLARGASQSGAGYRIGERRFALRAMIEQDPAATLAWLRREARRWQRRHAGRPGAAAADAWWAARAARTARLLGGMVTDLEAGRPHAVRRALPGGSLFTSAAG